MGVGPLAGLEASLAVAPISDRLRITFFAGWAELSSKRAQLIPGRGYDPAVIENVRMFPIELGMSFDLLRVGKSAVRVAAGGGVWLAQSQLIAFSTSSDRFAAGGVAEVGLSYRLRLGPGDLALWAMFVTGALPDSRQGGLVGFNAFCGSLSYVFSLLAQESP